MSISVTVSGEDSTSVILSSVLTELVSISGGSSVDVVASSGNSAIITVSSGDPISITGNYSNFVTGQVVRPPEITDFLTENQINAKITTATGDYNTLATNTFYLDSNPSGFITGVDLSSYIQNSETGSFYATSNPSGFITGVDLSSYTTEDFVTGISGLLQSQISSNYSDITGIINTTGSFVLKSETGSFISESETGQFYSTSNPSGFITSVDLSALETATGNLDTRVSSNSSDIINVSGLITSNDEDISALQTATGLLVQKSETGNFVTNSETGVLYPASNPSGFITGVDLSSYVQDSETGLFLVSGEDASISALQVGSTPVFPYTRTVKLHDDGVQFGARLALIGTTDNGFPGLEMVTDGDASKRTLIRHEGEGSNDYGISFYTTDASTASESVRFAGNGNVGIGTATPDEKLHLSATLGLNDGVFNKVSDTNGQDSYFGVYRYGSSNSYGMISFDEPDGNNYSIKGSPTFGTALNSPVGTDTRFRIGNVDKMVMDSDGNFGIGTTSPDELLHLEAAAIAGREVLMKATVSDAGNDHFGISNGTSLDNNFAPSFYGYKDSTYGNGYIYSLNFRGLVPDAQDTTQTNRFGIVHFEAYKTNNAADPNNGTFNSLTNRKLFTFSNGGNTVLEIDADNTVTISQDLSVSGDSLFSNRPTVNGTGVLLSGEGGGGTVENVVHTTGDQTISGTKSFGKISLSENSFVTETGSFTIGPTHRGATVLLQNSAPMTVTIPAQVSGHTTTFIAETSNSVVFATGAGISGFNSFNSANQIAGIYGQAQVIFKSPEYAFLGGNVV